MSSAAARLRIGHLRLRGVVGDGEELEGGERPDDQVDAVALDQLLRLGLGARGVAARVADDQLRLAAGERVVPVLEEADHALLHLDAALGERPGLHREQADADRLVLGNAGIGSAAAIAMVPASSVKVRRPSLADILSSLCARR